MFAEDIHVLWPVKVSEIIVKSVLNYLRYKITAGIESHASFDSRVCTTCRQQTSMEQNGIGGLLHAVSDDVTN